MRRTIDKGAENISKIPKCSETNNIPSREAMQKALEDRIGKFLTEKFSRGVVAVCGLGGLGSNIAISLARSGVGKLILVDFDRVDMGNLNRQQYKVSQLGMEKPTALFENLREIAPYVEIEAHCTKLDETNFSSILSSAQVICEAFDVPEDKSKLANFVLENLRDKVLISSSGMAGIDSANKIKTRKIAENFYICGDGVSDVDIHGTLFAPRVMLCAAHQSHLALQVIAGQVNLD